MERPICSQPAREPPPRPVICLVWEAGKGEEMTIKGGTDIATILATVKQYMDCGATVEQAIEKVEGILRGRLPDNTKALIYLEVRYRK